MTAWGLVRSPVKQELAQNGKPITLQLTNATVRDALNKITTQTGMHFWVARQTKGELSIDRVNFR
jgi:hypothetical protein